jgi:hypothetical protein
MSTQHRINLEQVIMQSAQQAAQQAAQYAAQQVAQQVAQQAAQQAAAAQQTAATQQAAAQQQVAVEQQPAAQSVEQQPQQQPPPQPPQLWQPWPSDSCGSDYKQPPQPWMQQPPQPWMQQPPQPWIPAPVQPPLQMIQGVPPPLLPQNHPGQYVQMRPAPIGHYERLAAAHMDAKYHASLMVGKADLTSQRAAEEAQLQCQLAQRRFDNLTRGYCDP